MLGKELKIAMLSIHSSPVGPLGAKDTGGMSVCVREVASELGKLGHQIDVYTRLQNLSEPEIIELGQNVRLIHLKTGSGKNLKKVALYSHIPEFARSLESFRKNSNLNYDLIFSHYWLSGCVGEYLSKWWGAPHMLMFHTLGAIKNTIGEKEPALRLNSERRLVKNCSRIIAPTEREKENLIKYYGASEETISVIPCGVNLELFRPLPKIWAKEQLGLRGNKVILFVGRIEKLKGIDRLIQATALLKNKEVSRLLIVGGDEQSKAEIKRLKNLARKLGVESLVIFIGRVKQGSLPLYYSASDVSVVPSHYESFGLVALEALACGTRVVATDVGDLRNIIRQGVTGYVVAEATPEALAEKIELVLSPMPCDGRTPALIRASVSRFGWQNIAEKLSGECYELITGPLPESVKVLSSHTTKCYFYP